VEKLFVMFGKKRMKRAENKERYPCSKLNSICGAKSVKNR